MEINNHHPHLNIDEIKKCKSLGVYFTVGSDAHEPKNIAVVDDCINRIIKANLNTDRVVNLQSVKEK